MSKVQVAYKNLEKSDAVSSFVKEKLIHLSLKFPDLQPSHIKVTLEMENSPHKAGRDAFSAKVHVMNGRYQDIVIHKKNLNIYIAIADMYEHMLEALNRFGDKARIKERRSYSIQSENSEL